VGETHHGRGGGGNGEAVLGLARVQRRSLALEAQVVEHGLVELLVARERVVHGAGAQEVVERHGRWHLLLLL